jgi:hypothetical protein
MIDRILRFFKHEEQAYNSCAGILHAFRLEMNGKDMREPS